MKKISSALLIGLSFVIGGCNWFGDGGSDNIVAPSPVIVQAMALPTIVEYNGSCLVSWKTENSTKTKVDGVQVNGSSIELKNLTENRVVEIIAYGEEGTLPASTIVSIAVSKPVIPTASDTLKIGYWTETEMYSSINNGASWDPETPDLKYDHIRYYFMADQSIVSYLYPYTKNDLFGNTNKWKVDGKFFVMGDQYYTFFIKNGVLTTFITKEAVDKIGNKIPIIHKYIYTNGK